MLPEVTQATSDALVRTLAKHPSERFPTYDELRMVLEAARSHLLVSQYSQPADGGGKPKTGWWRH